MSTHQPRWRDIQMLTLFLFGSSMTTSMDRGKSEPSVPKLRENFLSRLTVSTVAQLFYSPVLLCCRSVAQGWVKKKGKDLTLGWEHCHLYLRMCLTPLSSLPCKVLAANVIRLLWCRGKVRTSGWPLCLHHWYVLLSFNSAFYCSLGLILSLLIYSLTAFLSSVCFSFLLEFLSQSSVTSPKLLFFLPTFALFFLPLSLKATFLS